jgi:hypothetical protein
LGTPTVNKPNYIRGHAPTPLFIMTQEIEEKIEEYPNVDSMISISMVIKEYLQQNSMLFQLSTTNTSRLKLQHLDRVKNT